MQVIYLFRIHTKENIDLGQHSIFHHVNCDDSSLKNLAFAVSIIRYIFDKVRLWLVGPWARVDVAFAFSNIFSKT